MEYLDIYDENCRWLGFSRPCSEEYRTGEYQLIVHVCLLNEREEMLIQQRADTLSFLGGMWDLTIGGHVLAGEKRIRKNSWIGCIQNKGLSNETAP